MEQSLLTAIEQLKNGEEQGFNTIYTRTRNQVYFRAKQFLKNEQDVEDLMQIVYMEVYNKIHTLQTPEAFHGWLNEMVHRQSCMMLRKKKDVLLTEEGEGLFDTLESNDIDYQPELSAELKALSEIMSEIIEELPEERRAAVLMYYYDQMKIRQIADIMGCPEGTVKSNLLYAKKYMKERVETIEKTEGCRLHATAIPVILVALGLLSEKNKITAMAAEGVYEGACDKLGITPSTLNLAAEATTGTMAEATAESVMAPTAEAIAETATAVSSTAMSGSSASASAASAGAKWLSKKTMVYLATGVLAVGGIAFATSDTFSGRGENRGVLEVRDENPGEAVLENAEENTGEAGPEVGEAIADEGTDGEEIVAEPQLTEEELQTLAVLSYTVENGEITITGWDIAAGLTELTVPAVIDGYPVTKIGEMAFSIYEDRAFYELPTYSPLEKITLPETLREIGGMAFCETNLTSVVIPESVEVIEYSAFWGCVKLQTVNLPATLKKLGNKVFNGCERLNPEILVIPEGITEIGQSTFAGCKNLVNVVLPDNLTVIGDKAFYECEKLKLAEEFPKTLTTIGEKAFWSCQAITTVVLPDGFLLLKNYAFERSGIDKITMPSTTVMEENPFKMCYGYKIIYSDK